MMKWFNHLIEWYNKRQPRKPFLTTCWNPDMDETRIYFTCPNCHEEVITCECLHCGQRLDWDLGINARYLF